MIQTLESTIPNLAQVVKSVSPVPKTVLIIGMGQDGLPVCLDLSNPSSANVLVWDKLLNQGIKIIKTAAEYIMKYKNQSSYQTEFVVISNNTKEWMSLSSDGLGVWDKHACIAVVPFWDIVADQILSSLALWCVKEPSTRKPVILFIDGLENMVGEESVGHLKQILSIGRKRNIYIICTASSENRNKLSGWFEYFQKEVYGRDSFHWFEYDENRKTVVFFAPVTEI